VTSSIPETLHNQLPNGLFDRRVGKPYRVFPTGYFDLWGIDKSNELWLFELKTLNNTGVGIISELFYYANLAKEIFMTNKFNKKRTAFRGYSDLLEAAERGIKRIHACFLAPEFHSQISRDVSTIESILNPKGEIEYKFLKFDHCAVFSHAKLVIPPAEHAISAG
jgi:hypothetical protein